MSDSHGSEHPPLPAPHRRRWASVVMGIVLLLSGGVIGGSITGAYLFQRFIDVIHHPEEVPARLVSRMNWQYGLDDEQAEKIEAILSEGQQQLVEIRDRNYPDVMATLDDTRDRVLAVLHEDQKEKFIRNFNRIRDALVARPAD